MASHATRPTQLIHTFRLGNHYRIGFIWAAALLLMCCVRCGAVIQRSQQQTGGAPMQCNARNKQAAAAAPRAGRQALLTHTGAPKPAPGHSCPHPTQPVRVRLWAARRVLGGWGPPDRFCWGGQIETTTPPYPQCKACGGGQGAAPFWANRPPSQARQAPHRASTRRPRRSSGQARLLVPCALCGRRGQF